METVLIVDDSRVSRMMVKTIIAKSHPEWEIIEAASGDDAIVESKGNEVDTIILDYNMPGMSCEELAQKLRELYPEARMTLLTANVQDAVRERFIGVNVGHIAKPITEEKILSYINN